jgi:antitoxin CptB
MTDITALDPRRRRILYRARHRGTYENDLMIGGFVAAHIETTSETELDALEAVMELPDVDFADWLTGRRYTAGHGQPDARADASRDQHETSRK